MTQLRNISCYLLLLVCLLVLALFMLLGVYANPSSDDFCLASGINQEGLFRHLWRHYLEWSGRYSANALYGIYPLIFDLFDGYKLLPMLLLTALLAASAFFLSSLFRINITIPAVLLSSLVFVSLFVLGMMSTASSLYWMAGALTYQSANILLLTAFALMIRFLDQQTQGGNTVWTFTALLLVIFIAMGTNETSMLILMSIIGLIVIIKLPSDRLTIMPWLFLLAIALICFAVVFLSPGNVIRAADFPLRHDLSRSITGSLNMGIKILFSWMINPLLLTASILTPFAVYRLYLLSDRVFNISASLLMMFFFTTLAIPILLQFPAWWAMGGWPPARTVDAIYFIFLLSWFLSIGVMTLYFIHRKKEISAISRKIFNQTRVNIMLLSAAILFTLAVLNNHNLQLAWNDLRYDARPYHEYLTARYQLIEQALTDQNLSLIVPDYHRPYPRSLYFNDIMHSSRHWRNTCYADYFGLQKIKRSRH